MYSFKRGVKYWSPHLSNISEKAEIGEGSVIHAGVHIHDEVKIGINCQVEAGVFIPNGVTLGKAVFVGPGVIFTNDPDMRVKREEWEPTPTVIKSGVHIGAGAMILAGVTIGAGATIGMGAVVLKDVPPGEVWVGNPAVCKSSTKQKG